MDEERMEYFENGMIGEVLAHAGVRDDGARPWWWTGALKGGIPLSTARIAFLGSSTTDRHHGGLIREKIDTDKGFDDSECAPMRYVRMWLDRRDRPCILREDLEAVGAAGPHAWEAAFNVVVRQLRRYMSGKCRDVLRADQRRLSDSSRAKMRPELGGARTPVDPIDQVETKCDLIARLAKVPGASGKALAELAADPHLDGLIYGDRGLDYEAWSRRQSAAGAPGNLATLRSYVHRAARSVDAA